MKTPKLLKAPQISDVEELQVVWRDTEGSVHQDFYIVEKPESLFSPQQGWLPIANAPTKERQPIWLLVPGRSPQAAYSDTFWRGGFSVECKPTHWKPRTTPDGTLYEDCK